MSVSWKDVGQALPGGLKLLGSVLAMTGVGAPVGAAVAGVGALLGHALGVDPSSPDAVMAAIQADPAAAEKLLEVQANTKVQLQQLVAAQQLAELAAASQIAQAEFADKAGARSRDVEIIKAGKAGGQNWRADLMLLMAFSAVIVIAVLLASHQVAEATAAGGFLITIGGMFARNIGTAFDFEFGSSRSSKDKDVVIASQQASITSTGAAVSSPQQ